VVTGVSVRTRWWAVRLMLLAVLAMMAGQVVAMPVGIVSAHNAAAYHATSSIQTELGPEQPGIPCHHHGNAQGPLCCSAGDCPMLTPALSTNFPQAHPMIWHALAYRQHDTHPPPDTNAAPLLPPPRYLV
jgi:hypothetical protein